jgi:hypothetical protein
VPGELAGRTGAAGQLWARGQRLGDHAVQVDPLAGKKVGVHGLLQQRVAEGIADSVATDDQHLFRDRIA